MAETAKWRGYLISVKTDLNFFSLPYVLAKSVVEGTAHISEDLTFPRQINCHVEEWTLVYAIGCCLWGSPYLFMLLHIVIFFFS